MPEFEFASLVDEYPMPVQIVEVVVTWLTSTGDATKKDPVRPICEFWSRDGLLLARMDVGKPMEDVE